MARRLKKVFIVCVDNAVFGQLTTIKIYKYRDAADFACRRLQDIANEEQKKIWNANKPLPKYEVHGFYLAHENLFRD